MGLVAASTSLLGRKSSKNSEFSELLCWSAKNNSHRTMCASPIIFIDRLVFHLNSEFLQYLFGYSHPFCKLDTIDKDINFI